MAESDVDSKPQQQPQQAQGGLSRWVPSLPTNFMSMLTGDDETKTNSNKDTSPNHSNKNKSFLSSLLANASSDDPPSPEKDDASIMFAEPDASNSEDASREGSIDESGRRRSRRINRPKTCYSICHPAPTSSNRRKLHRRPRSLLQLHKLSQDARPKPAYEVVPSANFSVRLTRAITKVFKTKHGLCPNDLVVMRAEKYCAYEPDEDQEASDIVALICKGRKEEGGAVGKARICLPGGREWEAYPTPVGGYEFFSTDEHGLGLTVRWVPKRNKDGGKASDSSRKRFNFSTISPNSRKHPVIATLSKRQLDVNDTYKMPNPSAVTPLSTPKQASRFLTDAMDEEHDEMEHCQTDDRLRTIIVMTGLWVAFKEDWSPNFKYDDKEKDASALNRSPSMQNSPSKSATFSSPASTPPASPQQKPQLEKRSSIKSVGSNMFRTSSLMRKSNRGSTVSVPETEGEPSEYFETARKTGRVRADSASTVLVHRAASNRAKHHQATWRPDLLDSQREMSEPPSEDGSRNSSHVIAPFEGAVTQRRQSVARPLLPQVNDSDGANSTVATPRNKGGRASGASSPEKRESSTTTATTSTVGSEAARKPANRHAQVSPKKAKGWRRLLCGSSSADDH
ncbi:uncharacterized protein LTR77_001276 [Saxophila tyrrhenica]|uniref:Uncharacterized protein n=1 Tax=Saxophila tyrrhenica TaxID=1690608 RepID=A0AAV9PKC7_9PEZI|nr:hypothetical protein LTR77_001276 [Saxophila tyrrhenica]